MKELDKRFHLNLNGMCNPHSVIQGECYRFTVLTPQMLRMEYSSKGIFEDRPTQTVWNRNFDAPEFKVTDRHDRLEISTDYFHLYYNKKEFNENNLYIDIKCNYTNYGGRWRFGQTVYGNPPREHNLKGTTRTLDRTDGPAQLEFGLLDSSGRAFFNDSESMIMDNGGSVLPREKGAIDYYYFGYGRNYFKAIKDFYKLSGAVPMLPRYALGNWWSRYYPYSEESYKELLSRFEEEHIPFSVAVLDMDWHLVDIPEKYGRGWTGYTWNKDLFPDPERFLQWAHEHGYKITLNIHPADGVKAHEEMARELGVNIQNEDPIPFDICDPEFLEAYFKYLHHTNEKIGVDFWWIDWQQGKSSAIEGLDPLWMLNHYHTFDNMRNGKRGLILSRYAGLGSHRYPLGFSGDTVISWESLDFQPYFTTTASNVGYTWWSHDIGGHMNGVRDGELMVRWLQLGVFSPINRLHSNNSMFCAKEPWQFRRQYEDALCDAFRLRHRLVPYIYTMNRRCHTELVPFIIPLYYYYPTDDEAYMYKNQYFFGSELMVCPITSKTNPSTGAGSVEAWLPEGVWTDMFTGFVYSGGKRIVLNRGPEDIPVLAKAGAIIPLAVLSGNSVDNPEHLEILVFPGENNAFDLYEDESDNFSYRDGKFAITKMESKWSMTKFEFTLASENDLSVLPQKRRYTLTFRGFNEPNEISVNVPVKESYCTDTRSIILETEDLPIETQIIVSIKAQNLIYNNHDMLDKVFEFLNYCHIETMLKMDIYKCYQRNKSLTDIISCLNSMNLDKPLLDALIEITVC